MSAFRSFPAGPQSTEALARLVDGTVHGSARMVAGVAPLEGAPAGALAWCGRATVPGSPAVLLATAPGPGTTIVVRDPLRAFGQILRHLFEEDHPPGVHPGATVHPTAVLGVGVVVHAGCVVGPRVQVGDGTILFPNVTVYADTVVGARCRIHAGAVLGADGFRYAAGPTGPERIPQLGRLVLEDEVEVGANTCVDRAGLGETRIGRGSKLDNLVQVGHNSQLGPAVVLAGQAGLAGSVTVGAGAQVGGQAGIADHRSVGAGARVGAQSGVTQDVPDGETVLGTPAMSARAVRRLWATWRRTARGLVRRG